MVVVLNDKIKKQIDEHYVVLFGDESNIENEYKIKIINKDTYILNKNINISKDTVLNIEIYVQKVDDDNIDDKYVIYSINFYKNNKLVQEINLKDTLEFYDNLYYSIVPHGYIQFEDINFDGYFDIGVAIKEKDAYGNIYAYYL